MVDPIIEELACKRLGRTIKGKWRLDSLIGVGGMAAVYSATHRNGARVAIKMLHPTVSSSQQLRARFIREGYLANKVGHPGVVRVLDDDVDEADQSAFLVMDLIVGVTLADRAVERLLDDGELLNVAAQVLEVLQAAHEKGVVHRDLKPDNLLLDNNGKLHVLDFGIARLLDDTLNANATKTGTAFGTPGFMAPEQAMGRTQLISARTDLYTLGATLFSLACGDFVHAAESAQELMVFVATKPARSLFELAPYIPPEVISLIDRATKNAPEDRWASASEMLEEVRRIRKLLALEATELLPTVTVGDASRLRLASQGALKTLQRANSIFTPAVRKNRMSDPNALTAAPGIEGGSGLVDGVVDLGGDVTPVGVYRPSTGSLSDDPGEPPPELSRRRQLIPLVAVFGAVAVVIIVASFVVRRRTSAGPTVRAEVTATQRAVGAKAPSEAPVAALVSHSPEAPASIVPNSRAAAAASTELTVARIAPSSAPSVPRTISVRKPASAKPAPSIDLGY